MTHSKFHDNVAKQLATEAGKLRDCQYYEQLTKEQSLLT